jgi:hypothetical protein
MRSWSSAGRLAAVGKAFPNQLGPLRRSTISRSTLRVPRSPAFSHRLVPPALETKLTIGFVLLALAAYSVVQPPVGFAWRPDEYLFWLKLYGVFMLVWALQIGLVSGALFVLKWSIDWNFRFLILRRNSRRYGYAHKASVMATCGKYGQVISIRDPTLDETDKDYGEGRESSLGLWFQIFSEIESTLRPTLLHTWQRQVLLELEVTDFAVFDWIEEITSNMHWELRRAGERLPAHRILVIYSPENRVQIDDFFASCGGLFARRPHCLLLSRGPDDEYIWSDHEEFKRLHKALSALAEEPRGAHPREAIGVWPYPRREL